MLLLASSVCGLFKWRQFETGGHPYGSGMVPAFFTVVPRRGGVARRAGSARRSRHRLEVGSALRPGSQSAPALKAQADECHDSAIVSAGVSVHWTPAIATYVNYDGQLGRNRYDSNAVTGGVRISF